MDFIQILTELINTVGVPVAMIAYFIWDKTTVMKEQENAIEKMTDAINNNTMVMEKIADKLKMEV
jgi:hypothetical protein|uniref:YvrJ protein family protein n=1 Tax=Tectiviridae sp. TaxID=2831614 RepID=A0A8S5VUG2_9VIRU|nr:MAG TPA: YvrJ protein family protein [Tectiviridae sp.]